MVIDVHITDWKTVLRFASRADFIHLITREPHLIEEQRAVRVWMDRGRGEGFEPARLQFVRKGAVGLVVQVPVAERDAFLAENAPDLLDHIREKEAARAHSSPEATA